EVQIALSEDYLKPLHGNAIFGQLLVRRLQMIDFNWFDCAVISDSGFIQEAYAIIKAFGEDSVQLWRIHREGCDFKKDSRDYINLDHFGIASYDIINNGSMNDLRDIVLPLYHAMILPREKIHEGDNKGDLEHEKLWLARRTQAAQDAFENWSDKKIARIKKEKNNDTDTTVLPTEQGDKDSDSGGSTVSGGC
ncbi:MAG: hypothetical protein QQN63_08760, partial [Nitrosopumilus sp.]